MTAIGAGIAGQRVKKRCAIYARTGHCDPPDRVPLSILAQRAACIAQARQHPEWSVIEQHYDDAGKPGTSLDRPALQRLLRHVEAGYVDIVVVHEVSRLTRCYLDFVAVVERVRNAGADLVSVTEGFSTLGPRGRSTLALILAFAPLEREMRGAPQPGMRGRREDERLARREGPGLSLDAPTLADLEPQP